MKSSVEDDTKVWRKEQGGPASPLTFTSPHSAPVGPPWNAEGWETTDETWSIYLHRAL